MIVDKEIVKSVSVYGSTLADQATQHGIVTAVTSAQISNFVLCGVTLGGWITIILFLGTLLMFIMNVSKFVRWGIHRYKSFKKWQEHRHLLEVDEHEPEQPIGK